MKKSIPNPKANKSILLATYCMVGLFMGMLGYFGWFLQFDREDTINNSYNARLDQLETRVLRGELRDNEGRALARTVVDGQGGEIREYPYGALFAHAVGYSNSGKAGLESLANFYLLGSHVNLAEKAVNELNGIRSPGDTVSTTLNVDLQQAAFAALGDRKGAVLAMEPDTGKVLAMVSKPGFDPNTLQQDWEGLVDPDNHQAQLVNRATQGLYPPGSIFKIVTVLEYMREHPDGYQNFTFDCDGIYEQEEYAIRCFHGNAHGHQNLSQAFANSCNGAFAVLGQELDLAKLHSLAEELLFNQALPLSMAYNKSSYGMEAGASTWEVLQTSIGQGVTQVSPMHSAMLVAAIANGGTLMKPYFIERVDNVAGQEVKRFLPEAYGSLMTASEAAGLGAMLRQVVTEGTGSAVRTDAYAVAGKTGSAEFETGKETHAWFVGYAPYEHPEIVVAVIVEEAGSGGQVAAPVAKGVFDAYFGMGR